MDDNLKLGIDSSGARAGASEFEGAIRRIERALDRLDNKSAASLARMQAVAGRGGFARIARDMAAMANVNFKTANVKNLEAMSRALNGFNGPKADAVRRTAELSLILSSFGRGNLAGLQQSLGLINQFRGPSAAQAKNIGALSAAINTMKGPDPQAARRIADLFMMLNGFTRMSGVQQGIAGMSAMLNGLRGPSVSSVRNLAGFASELMKLQPPPNAQRLIDVLNSLSRAAANMRNVRFPNFTGPFNQLSAGAIRATGAMRGLENQFSLSYQAGTLFRGLLMSLTLGGFTRGVMEASRANISFRASMATVLETGEEVDDMLGFLQRQADRLGLDILSVQRTFPRLAISMMESGQSADTVRRIYEVWGSSMRVLGLEAQNQELVWKALTQVFSKGTVSAEELRQQLGDQLPAVFNLLEQELERVTGAEVNLFDEMRRGNVSSEAMLLLTERLAETYGSQVGPAMQTASAQMARLRNRFTEFALLVGQSGLDQGLADAFQRIGNAMDSPEFEQFAQRLGQSMGNAARMFADGIIWAVENIDLLVDILKIFLALSVAQSLMDMTIRMHQFATATNVATVAQNLFNISLSGIGRMAGIAGRAFTGLNNTLISGATAAAGAISRPVTTMRGLGTAATGAGTAIAGAFGRIGPAIAAAGPGIMQLASRALPMLVAGARAFPGTALIASIVGIGMAAVETSGIFDMWADDSLTTGDIIGGVLEEIGANFASVAGWIGEKAGEIWEMVSGAFKAIFDAAKWVANGLINLFVAAGDIIIESFSQVARSVGGMLTDLAGSAGAAMRGDWALAGSLAADAFTTSAEEGMEFGDRIADRIGRTMSRDRFEQLGELAGDWLMAGAEGSGFMDFQRGAFARAQRRARDRMNAELRGTDQEDTGFETDPIDLNAVNPWVNGAPDSGGDDGSREARRLREESEDWVRSLSPAIELGHELNEIQRLLAQSTSQLAAAGMSEAEARTRATDALREQFGLMSDVEKALRDLTLQQERYDMAVDAGLITQERANQLAQRGLVQAQIQMGLFAPHEQAVRNLEMRLQDLNEIQDTLLAQGIDMEAVRERAIQGYLRETGAVSESTTAMWDYADALNAIAAARGQGLSEGDANSASRRAGTSAMGSIVGDSGTDFQQRITQLQQLREEGSITAQQYNMAMAEMTANTLEFQVAMGEGTYVDQFLAGLTRMTEGARNMQATMGDLMTQAATSITQGIGDSLARAIVYAEDLQTALYDVVNQALSQLISGLIQMGIQMIINQMIGQAAQTAATTAATTAGGTVAGAWAPAAAAVSLASFGSNAAPAMMGIGATYAMTQALSMAGGLGMKDGGEVIGPGTGTSDSVPRMLSNGEFVVNAQAAAANMGTLQAINNGAVAGGGMGRGGDVTVQEAPVTVNAIYDPAAVMGAMSSVEGERVIMTVLGNNSDKIRNLLSR